jgi:hypothetical protein
VNGIPGRSLTRAAIAAIVLFQAPLAIAATNDAPTTLTKARPAHFDVIKKYSDGPWVLPTLELVRSDNEWNALMTAWLTEQRVVGREAAPVVDWTHDAVIVLALGSQFASVGVSVKDCVVEGDVTVLDLHFETGDQWDPNGQVEHPAVILAISRADLKDIELRCDATIDGLPPSANRRNGLRIHAADGSTFDVAQAPAGESVTSGSLADAKTTWGRVKADYRGVPTR